MKNYVAICYSVHNKKISNYQSFDTKAEARISIEKHIQHLCEEGKEVAAKGSNIDKTINEDGTASLSINKGQLEWTWEIIEV